MNRSETLTGDMSGEDEVSELMRKVRRIRFEASHRVDDLLAGGWNSAFHGQGIEFEEVRPYDDGDDAKAIDWNVTARTGTPFVKLFREERELTIEILVDVSPSIDFGTELRTKRELAAELVATIAISAMRNQDKVGVTFFADDVEQSLPARKGTKHVLRIIRDMVAGEFVGRGSDVGGVLWHLARVSRRRSIVFLISDFQAPANWERPLRLIRQKHDVIPIIVEDRHENELPSVGLLNLRDPETGEVVLVDTSSASHRNAFAMARAAANRRRDEAFTRLRIDPLPIRTGEEIDGPLQRYFGRRRP